MNEQTQSTVLVVGAASPPRSTLVLDVYTAASVREALATIRLVSFDLLIAGLENPAIDVWSLIERVSTAWPQQRWLLASSRLRPEEEILARSLGAAMVLSAMPDAEWIAECAASLRQRGVATRVQPLPVFTAASALADFAEAKAL